MTAKDLLDLVWLVPLLPLTGAVVLLLAGKRIGEPKAGWLATALMGLAFVWSVVMLIALLSLPGEERTHVSNVFTWLSAGTLKVHLGFLADPLSVTWILLVTGVGSLIHLYAVGYMHGDERYGRFFAYFNLFATAMLILVLGSSFLLTFLGWEGVGLCSYLLIGFWFERTRASSASVKAFVTNRVGDFGFMVAMFFIVGALGSLDYTAMANGAGGLSKSTATAIALLLFVGCVGKSAQIGLHVWLPDAMEGPTPVSALIHAATMVTAGVYLVCRAHPFFERSGVAMDVVAIVGALTALIAGTVALVQPDIKRVLAYSTVSQLGYMFLAAGVGAYAIAVFFVLAHAFYKAALFLGSGTVIHGTEETQDIRRMGGLRKYMPFTAAGFGIAWVTIVGLPPFSGFWAKDGVLAAAFYDHNYLVWAIGLAAALLTGFYMTRETMLVFSGNERFRPSAAAGGAEGADAHAAPGHMEHDITASPTVDYGMPVAPAHLGHDPHEGTPTMILPVVVLAGLAMIAGVLELPFHGLEFLSKWLEPTFKGAEAAKPTSFLSGFGLSMLAVAVGVTGIVFALRLYRRGLDDPEVDPIDAKLGGIGRLFGHAWYYDEGIAAMVGGPLRRSAQWLADGFDQKVLDGGVNGVARLFGAAGTGMRKLQTGLVRQYAVGIAAGMVALLIWTLWRVGVA